MSDADEEITEVQRLLTIRAVVARVSNPEEEWVALDMLGLM